MRQPTSQRLDMIDGQVVVIKRYSPSSGNGGRGRKPKVSIDLSKLTDEEKAKLMKALGL